MSAPADRVCFRSGCHAKGAPLPLRRFLTKTGKEARACDRCRAKGRDATAALRRRHRPDPEVAEAERLLGVARAARGRAARALMRAVRAVDRAKRDLLLRRVARADMERADAIDAPEGWDESREVEAEDRGFNGMGEGDECGADGTEDWRHLSGGRAADYDPAVMVSPAGAE